MSTIVAFKGWNSSLTSWGSSTWGGEVAFTGATASVDSVTVTGTANVSVTGVAGTSALGSITITGDANVSVTGVAGTSAVGSSRYFSVG